VRDVVAIGVLIDNLGGIIELGWFGVLGIEMKEPRICIRGSVATRIGAGWTVLDG
jgi:hypothetical protein